MLIALVARDGNMFTPEFFDALKKATDEVLVMDGIDRGRVQSLFTPNVRYMEVVEDGIEAGNVVDSEFVPTPEALAQVRENILKAGIRRPPGRQRFLRRAGLGASCSSRTPPANPSTPSRWRSELESTRARQDPGQRRARAGAGRPASTCT